MEETPQPKRRGLLSYLYFPVGVTAAVGNAVLAEHWSMSNPQAPDRASGHVIAYHSHNWVYITREEWWFSQILPWVAVLFIVLGLVDHWDRTLPDD